MPQFSEDDTGSLERARERLYRPVDIPKARKPLSASSGRETPHEWDDEVLTKPAPSGERHVRIATVFFVIAVVFFVGALATAAYFLYYGGNAVSIDKISIDIQGPTTIAGGDTVPLSLIITNKNPVDIENATIEIDFPAGTRDAKNVLTSYPHYVENLGTLASGASVTRSVKAVVFGGAGQNLSFPVSLSYNAAGSNGTFSKKSSYALAITSTPLELTVDTLAETVSNKPLTFTLTVRSNAAVPLSNVVLTGVFPFGFLVSTSSLPLNNSSFLIGRLQPGATKTVMLTGTLTGQNKEQRVFHFTVGTANTSNNQTLAVTYMTQDATVTIAAPFIDTTLALNGDTSGNTVLAPASFQNVTVTYSNTLGTTVGNASVVIALSGSSIDYASVRAANGFYNSSDRTIIFSRDTDPALSALAPGATGIGAFSFSTLPPSGTVSAPNVTFAISVSGTRVGQLNVPENVSSSLTKTFKVSTLVALTASSFHSTGPFGNSGPVPPTAEQATTYTVIWGAQNKGSAVAGGTVKAILPSYVSFITSTTGSGTLAYDEKARSVTWNVGDIAQGRSAEVAFQVSLTPSTSQRGSAPPLTSSVSFSGFDRYAGVQVAATAAPVTTETVGDAGYVPTNAIVQ